MPTSKAERPESGARPAPVFGIGLNKTGTKTLGHYLGRWGFRNRTYDSNVTTHSPSFDLYAAGRTQELLDLLEDYDSAEDWPWPLLYSELDERFPGARFVLTVRRDPDVWYRSLCNMAVRIGPFPLYERSVYGSSMPQGRKRQHVQRYLDHNAAVRAHFADRPQQLLTLCWDTGDGAEELAAFLGLGDVDTSPVHVNPSPRNVYDGDRLWLAQLHRLRHQQLSGPGTPWRRVRAALARRLGRGPSQ